MTPRRRFLICLALLIALAAALPAGGAAASSPARAWLTTGDGANLLAEQPPDALGAPAPAAPMIAVDPSRSYQRIEGLGASITDSSAHLIAHSPDRDAITRSLARLTVIVGASCSEQGCRRRSSATTTTGRCTPTTSVRQTIRPTPSTPGRCSPIPMRAATWPGRRSTATSAIRSASRPSTTSSRRRTSTSPSARARSRPTRRRPSRTRCTGTPATGPSARRRALRRRAPASRSPTRCPPAPWRRSSCGPRLVDPTRERPS